MQRVIRNDAVATKASKDHWCEIILCNPDDSLRCVDDRHAELLTDCKLDYLCSFRLEKAKGFGINCIMYKVLLCVV